MKKNLTELVFILDKSGSMCGLESDTIGGFNSTIKSQKKEDGEALVSTVLFNSKSTVIHDRVPLTKIKLMSERDYRPGGCTALLDAVGDAVHHIETVHKYIREEDVPEHTVFVIITDGYENASRRYRYEEIHARIEEKKRAGWEFLFLGANIDAAEAAASIGIDPESAADFLADTEGCAVVYGSVSSALSSMRRGENVGSAWKASVTKDYHARKR